MAFLFGRKKKQKEKLFKNVTRGVDPMGIWKIAGDLGEGSFGMVHKVRVCVVRGCGVCICVCG
jgi:hypothetical protein